MKKIVFLSLIVVIMIALVSCSSIEAGVGYAGYHNGYSLIDTQTGKVARIDDDGHITQDASGTELKTIGNHGGFAVTTAAMFNFNSLDYGFRLFDEGVYGFVNDNYYVRGSFGPAWEFRLDDRFAVVTGLGVSLDVGLSGVKKFTGVLDDPNSTQDQELEALKNVGVICDAGVLALVEGRYFMSEHVFLGLKGTFGYGFKHFLDVSDDLGNINIDGTSLKQDIKNSLTYSAALVLGRTY